MERTTSSLIMDATQRVPNPITKLIKNEKVIYFPEGLIGFSSYKRYILLHHSQDQETFFWLKSIESGAMSFPITSPLNFLVDYKIQIPLSDLASIQLTDERQADVLSVVTVPQNKKEIWLNLQAPLIINKAKKLGKQVALSNDLYPLRYRVQI